MNWGSGAVHSPVYVQGMKDCELGEWCCTQPGVCTGDDGL